MLTYALLPRFARHVLSLTLSLLVCRGGATIVSACGGEKSSPDTTKLLHSEYADLVLSSPVDEQWSPKNGDFETAEADLGWTVVKPGARYVVRHDDLTIIYDTKRQISIVKTVSVAASEKFALFQAPDPYFSHYDRARSTEPVGSYQVEYWIQGDEMGATFETGAHAPNGAPIVAVLLPSKVAKRDLGEFIAALAR